MRLKKLWKRWYFANLVRKSFIRRGNIGIVFVIKELDRCSNPECKEEGVKLG
jgi:hypothetical protein